jgi:hypothetical protein
MNTANTKMNTKRNKEYHEYQMNTNEYYIGMYSTPEYQSDYPVDVIVSFILRPSAKFYDLPFSQTNSLNHMWNPLHKIVG